ncbi:hypothetical protein LCGC14_0344910 [marine sediment metagenome]|uniref:Uncharacterized protein n=1 Tax=marine sediment metagenome TaxID=412755 RepID=A0A0F9TCP7_9ZZZZ
MTDFLRAPSKKSLLAMLKNVGELTSREWTRFFDGVLFKSEFNKIVGGDDTSGSSGGGFSFANFLKRDGTTKLTADWNAGSQKIRAKTLQSDVSTGTAPLTVASTTKVSNLNADLLDSQTGTYYLASDNFTGTEWTDLTDSGASTLHKHDHGGQDGLGDDDHTRYLDKDGTRALTGDWDAGSARKITVGAVSAGASDFGDGGTTNYAEFESDGTLKFNGTATVFDDLRVPITALRVGPAGAPDFAQFRDDGSGSTGVFAYWFDPNTEQQVYLVIQMPHSWKEGSNITPHVHWVSADTAVGAGTDVSWGFEYTWASINGVFDTTTLVYADEQSGGASEILTVNKHYKTYFSGIVGAGHTISSMLICRLFRDATSTGGTDDYDDDAGLIEIDFHYEIDTIGSKTELGKAGAAELPDTINWENDTIGQPPTVTPMYSGDTSTVRAIVQVNSVPTGLTKMVETATVTGNHVHNWRSSSKYDISSGIRVEVVGYFPSPGTNEDFYIGLAGDEDADGSSPGLPDHNVMALFREDDNDFYQRWSTQEVDDWPTENQVDLSQDILPQQWGHFQFEYKPGDDELIAQYRVIWNASAGGFKTLALTSSWTKPSTAYVFWGGLNNSTSFVRVANVWIGSLSDAWPNVGA